MSGSAALPRPVKILVDNVSYLQRVAAVSTSGEPCAFASERSESERHLRVLLIQSAGIDVHLFQLQSIAHVFADVYRIDPSDTFAKTRFDNLFLPLVLIFAASLPCLAVSIIRNLPSILGDLLRNWVSGAAGFLFGLWLELFVRGKPGTKICSKRLSMEG
jgi:hypothetical protein